MSAPVCPKCENATGDWPYRVLAHSQELALECPSCGTILTEAFLRDVQGVTLPPRTLTWVQTPAPAQESPDQ